MAEWKTHEESSGSPYEIGGILILGIYSISKGANIFHSRSGKQQISGLGRISGASFEGIKNPWGRRIRKRRRIAMTYVSNCVCRDGR